MRVEGRACSIYDRNEPHLCSSQSFNSKFNHLESPCVLTPSSTTQPIGHRHLSGNLDFTELFSRESVSSLSRAKAFLWLCYHYLESPSSDNEDDYDGEGSCNPFNDGRGRDAPTFIPLSESEAAQENVDPNDEKILGEKLVLQRTEILKAQGIKESHKMQDRPSAAGSMMGDDDDELVHEIDGVIVKGKNTSGKSKPSTSAKEKKAAASALRRLKLKEAKAKEQAHRAAPALESEEDGHDNLREEFLGFPP